MSYGSKLWHICSVEAFPASNGFSFRIPVAKDDLDGFIIRWQDNWYAYLNRCPHTGVSLNWSADQFFDLDERFIQCGMHGALFEPSSGLCIHGPCLGDSLRTLDCIEENGQLYIELSKIEEIDV